MKLRHFSIRDVLFVVTLLAIICAWWVNNRRQRLEIERLEADLKASKTTLPQGWPSVQMSWVDGDWKIPKSTQDSPTP